MAPEKGEAVRVGTYLSIFCYATVGIIKKGDVSLLWMKTQT